MTPDRRWTVRLHASFFLKILLVFVGGFTAVGLYLAASFWYFDWQSERLTVRRSAMNYAQLILKEVGDPPDTATAREVAERLDVGLRIEGPGLDWASDPDFPAFSAVELPPVGDEGSGRAGFSRDIGFSADITRGPYRYLVALQPGGTPFGSESATEDFADAVFMILLLACVYLATRHLLRPVRELSEGVERLRRGDLNIQMRTRRTDELGRLMTSFNEMAEAVRERISARDQLLVDVSHEVRTPLTRMRVALEMMPDSSAKESVVEDIEETEAMISELLETERLDSPHGGLELVSTDVAELVAEVVAARSSQAPGIEVSGADRRLVAEVDPERISVVVGNLVSNALRHSRSEGPPVRVSLESEEGDVVITVHDQGAGIPEHDLPRIFEPFYRVDRSRSRDTGGYGIGLSLVKRIVDAHGGTIGVTSEVGRGTSVRVTLPHPSRSPTGHGPGS